MLRSCCPCLVLPSGLVQVFVLEVAAMAACLLLQTSCSGTCKRAWLWQMFLQLQGMCLQSFRIRRMHLVQHPCFRWCESVCIWPRWRDGAGCGSNLSDSVESAFGGIVPPCLRMLLYFSSCLACTSSKQVLDQQQVRAVLGYILRLVWPAVQKSNVSQTSGTVSCLQAQFWPSGCCYVRLVEKCRFRLLCFACCPDVHSLYFLVVHI